MGLQLQVGRDVSAVKDGVNAVEDGLKSVKEEMRVHLYQASLATCARKQSTCVCLRFSIPTVAFVGKRIEH